MLVQDVEARLPLNGSSLARHPAEEQQGNSCGRTFLIFCSGASCALITLSIGALGFYMYASAGGQAGLVDGACQQDTGGECDVSECWDWRRATCSAGRCVCPPGRCAREGSCVLELDPPASKPKEVAVVGCGIAGALTALELAHRGLSVTVFDREASCGVGTSGRIAAEMMFYSYNKAFFHGGWASIESAILAVQNMQASASADGIDDVAKFVLKSKKLSGNTIVVKFIKYKKGALTFKRGTGSPQVEATCSSCCSGDDIVTVTKIEPGWLIEDVARETKKVTAYDLHRANEADSVDEEMQKLLSGAEYPMELTFLIRGEPRTNKVYEAGFFEAAGHRLRDFFLVHYPELCEAVISPLCCVPGTIARTWVDNNPEKAGYRCPADPFAAGTGLAHGMGVVHVFSTETVVNNMNADGEPDPWNFEVWSESETNQRMKYWLAGQSMFGAAINRKDSGFVRTELIFHVIQQILTRKGTVFRFGRELTRISMTANTTSMEMRFAGGHWADSAENVRTFHPGPAGQTETFHDFDRVVISTGGAIGSALDELDPTLKGDHQLLPVMGYIIVGPPGQLPPSEHDIGVVFENEHMYLRATRNGSFAIGGGMYVTGGNDEDVRALRWDSGLTEEHGYFDANRFMKQARIAEQLLQNPKTLKSGGCRPMSVFGNFPTLKSYGGGRVVLNTGGGANGFVNSWKSGQLATDLVMHGTVEEMTWKKAFTKL